MSKFNDFLKASLLIIVLIYAGPSIIFSIKKQWAYKLETHNRIGYITIDGEITNSSFYRKYLSTYFKDASIKAILLKIESDGGAAGSCQALAYDIENLKKEFPKPIIAYTENKCTCGAYQIAAATDYIVAIGSCIVGNIGISPQITLPELSDNTYQQITKDVAFKRHLQLNKIDQWGQGKLFTGQQAYDLKLIDAIGSKTTAINLLKKNIIPSDRKIEWVSPSTKSYIEKLNEYQDENADLDMN